MPELPEVETVRRGLAPLLLGEELLGLVVRQPRLRWEIPVEPLAAGLTGQVVQRLERRGKYLLLGMAGGWAILHLGMSGVVRVMDAGVRPGPHDHWDLRLAGGRVLRYTDPRRFGALLWCAGDPLEHPRLRGLGPEPLGRGFSAGTLLTAARGRRVAVKGFLMDGRVGVGVGNIYANEALFRARIHPQRPAAGLTPGSARRLVAAVKGVLKEAIAAGGTTLRDFLGADGRHGYFVQSLQVYGREGEPCRVCGTPIARLVQGQRATCFCPRCQRR